MRQMPTTGWAKADPHTVQYLPAPRASREQRASTVPLRSHPWGQELVAHEERKRALEAAAAPPADLPEVW